MELESNKYKKRLIIICIIMIISIILGQVAKTQTKKESDYFQNLVEIIQATPEEEYNNAIEESSENETTEDQNATGEETENQHYTKAEALQIAQTISDEYMRIFKYPDAVVTILFTLALSGSIIGIMMYFIFTGWILNKIWPDIKKWLSVLMRILAFIILFYVLYYILILIGIYGQIPFIIYTIYKYIKLKKSEDKDDVIQTK